MTELPDELRALGRAMTVQAPDDLPDRVLAAIAMAPPRPARWRRWLAAVTGLLAALVVTALLAAPVRAAIVHVFQFGGVEVHHGTGPSPAPSPALPGQHASDIESAGREVGFPVRVPESLGAPDSVTVADSRVVSLHYTAASGPVQLDEFAGTLGVLWDKYAGSGIAVPTMVNGHQALWFEQPVTLQYIDADGRELPESVRETDGTLLWIDGTVTIRLDGVRPLAAALAVATSTR